MLKTQFHPAHKSGSKALMIVLHGLGDSVAGYQWLPAALALPSMNYLLVNAPDPYYGGFSWFDFTGNFGPGVERSRKLLFELIDAQRANGFPAREMTLFGFSQGSLMTVDVGLRYSQKFAGLVGISGAVYEPEKLLKEMSPVAMQQRLLITHGIADTMIPFQTRRRRSKRSRLTASRSSGTNWPRNTPSRAKGRSPSSANSSSPATREKWGRNECSVEGRFRPVEYFIAATCRSYGAWHRADGFYKHGAPPELNRMTRSIQRAGCQLRSSAMFIDTHTTRIQAP